MKLDLSKSNYAIDMKSYGDYNWYVRGKREKTASGFQDPFHVRYKTPPLPTVDELPITPGSGIREQMELGDTIVYPDLSVGKVERAIERIMESTGYKSIGSPGDTSLTGAGDTFTDPYGSTLDVKTSVERTIRSIKSRRSGRSHAQELLGDLMSHADVPIPVSEYELPEALSHLDIEHMVADEPAYEVALMEFMDENAVTAKSMTHFNDRFELKNLDTVFN